MESKLEVFIDGKCVHSSNVKTPKLCVVSTKLLQNFTDIILTN
jgi:hypothetical protein